MKEPKILTPGRLAETIQNMPYCHSVVFGTSLSGQPLNALTVGSGRPLTLCVAVHHAMEWLPGWALLSFAERFVKAEAENKAPFGSFCIIPLLNPDGTSLLEYGAREGDVLAPRQIRANGGSPDFSHWQANGRGVDLNHNYPAGFEDYRRVEAKLGIWEGSPTRYSGVSPLSEPETGALAALIDILSPDLTLAFHTQGEEVFCGSADGRRLLLAHLVARRLGFRLSCPTGAAMYGGLTDWLTARGMHALTLECGRGTNPLPPVYFRDMDLQLSSFLFSIPSMFLNVNKL